LDINFQVTADQIASEQRSRTSILFLKIEQGNLFWATKLQEIKEWEALESK